MGGVTPNVVVLDNGGYTAKINFSDSDVPRLIPNCVMKVKSERRRLFVGDQIEECRDTSGLYYMLPTQKGYTINWDIQKTLWDFMFGKDGLQVNFSKTSIILTEPYFNFGSCQEALNEIFFEDYGFDKMLRTNPADMCLYKYTKQNPESKCCLVVDSGYSFTHVIPYIRGKKYMKAMKRIDIGGKNLTNYLKEIISYRQLYVMDETYVVNQLKEDTCYVSLEFKKDMERARQAKDNPIVREYVLPDYTTIRRGFVRDPGIPGEKNAGEQVLKMNNERFTIPEILFHPSDIGIPQMGIPECIVSVINDCPPETQAHMYYNILLVGGNSLFPGFRDRVFSEVRSMAPAEYEVRVTKPDNPVTYSWEGGALISKDSEFKNKFVSQKDYEECGHSVCSESFDI